MINFYVVLQVQNLIERCLQLYMNQKEVMNTLLIQAKIEPSFTELGAFLSFSSSLIYFSYSDKYHRGM